jgi:hypothetical protein
MLPEHTFYASPQHILSIIVFNSLHLIDFTSLLYKRRSCHTACKKMISGTFVCDGQEHKWQQKQLAVYDAGVGSAPVALIPAGTFSR